jgi:hypothetical protein
MNQLLMLLNLDTWQHSLLYRQKLFLRQMFPMSQPNRYYHLIPMIR